MDNIVSLGAERAHRSRDAGDWSPRDLLLDFVARMDAGENFDMMIVVYRKKGPEGGLMTGLNVAGGANHHETLGLLNRAGFELNHMLDHE